MRTAVSIASDVTGTVAGGLDEGGAGAPWLGLRGSVGQVPEAARPTIPTPPDSATGSPGVADGAPAGEPPPPRGADMIVEGVPFDPEGFSDALFSSLPLYRGRPDPLGGHAPDSHHLLPAVLAAAAFEAVRRWRRRHDSAGPPVRRSRRGFAPGGLV